MPTSWCRDIGRVSSPGTASTRTSLRSDGFGGVFGSVSAFGHEGPWSDRAGWEQLAQSTSGLCLDPLGDDKPVMLPCAATDYTTGFVMAAGIMEALDATLADGRSRRVDGSLCQTAAWILRVGRLGEVAAPSGFAPELLRSETGFGVVEHLGSVRRRRRSRRRLDAPDHAARGGNAVVVNTFEFSPNSGDTPGRRPGTS